MTETPVRFAVINVNHGHINAMVGALLREAAEFIAFYAPEPDLAAQFSARYPQVPLARSAEEILEDPSI